MLSILLCLQVPAVWQFPADYYSGEELCRKLRTAERRIEPDPSIRDRVYVVSLKERSFDECKTVLEKTLDLEFVPIQGGFRVSPSPESKQRDKVLLDTLESNVERTWKKVFAVANPFVRKVTVPPVLEPVEDAIRQTTAQVLKPLPSPDRPWSDLLWRAPVPWEEKAGLAAARGLLRSERSEMPMSGPLFYQLQTMQAARLIKGDYVNEGDGYFWRDTKIWPEWVNFYATAWLRQYEEQLGVANFTPAQKQEMLDGRARATRLFHRIHLNPLDLSIHFEYVMIRMTPSDTMAWAEGDLVPSLSIPTDETWLPIVYKEAELDSEWNTWIESLPENVAKAEKEWLLPKYESDSVSTWVRKAAEATGTEVCLEVSMIRDLAPDRKIGFLGEPVGRLRSLGSFSERGPDSPIANLPAYRLEKVGDVWTMKNAWSFLDRQYSVESASRWVEQARRKMTLANTFEWAKNIGWNSIETMARTTPFTGNQDAASTALLFKLLSRLPLEQRKKVLAMNSESTVKIPLASLPPQVVSDYFRDWNRLQRLRPAVRREPKVGRLSPAAPNFELGIPSLSILLIGLERKEGFTILQSFIQDVEPGPNSPRMFLPNMTDIWATLGPFSEAK